MDKSTEGFYFLKNRPNRPKYGRRAVSSFSGSSRSHFRSSRDARESVGFPWHFKMASIVFSRTPRCPVKGLTKRDLIMAVREGLLRYRRHQEQERGAPLLVTKLCYSVRRRTPSILGSFSHVISPARSTSVPEEMGFEPMIQSSCMSI